LAGVDALKQKLIDFATFTEGRDATKITEVELSRIARSTTAAGEVFSRVADESQRNTIKFQQALSEITQGGDFTRELNNILGKAPAGVLAGRMRELFETAIGQLGGAGRLDIENINEAFDPEKLKGLTKGIGQIFEKEFGPGGSKIVEEVFQRTKGLGESLQNQIESGIDAGAKGAARQRLQSLGRTFFDDLSKEFFKAAQSRRQEQQQKAQRAAQAGLIATQFEFGEGLTASFQDLKAILDETDDETRALDNSFSQMRQVFKDVNAESRGFSKLVDLFRTSIAKLSVPLGQLQANTIRLTTPFKELAIAEARIAKAEAQRARAAFRIERTAAESTAERDFSESLSKAGFDVAAIGGLEAALGEPLQKAIQGFVDRGVTDVGEISKKLGQIGIITSAALQGLSGPAAEEALKKFIGAQIKIREKEAQVGQKEVAARQAAIRGLEAEIKLLDESAQRRKQLIEIEQLRSSVITDQLTGLDQIVMKERELAQFGLQRVAVMEQELANLKGLASDPGRNTDERERLNDEIVQLERKLTTEVISQVKRRNALQRQALERSIAILRKESQFVNQIATGRDRLVDLLGREQSAMQKFNAGITRNLSKFETGIGFLRNAIVRVSNSTLPAVEKEKMLVDLRREAANLTLEAATAEAELLAERRSAAEQLTQEALQNQDSLRQAQQQAIDASRALSDAILNYKDAVQSVIAATTDYNVELRLSSVEATRIVGGFRSFREEISTVGRIFRNAEQAARAVGAGEKVIADLRKKSIEEQISLFQQAIQEQAGAAEQFFGSSRQSQAELFKGIQAVRGLVSGGLFGNSFQEFSKLGVDAINQIGAQLLSLPDTTRQQVLRALDVLEQTGAKIGNFTADELRNAINTAAFGATPEGGATDVDPLVELQARLAELTEEQARLQLDSLIAANEQIVIAREQVEEARANKDLSQIQIERIIEAGDKISNKLGAVGSQLAAPILQQTGILSQGFVSINTSLSDFTARLETAIRGLALGPQAPLLGAGQQTINRVEQQGQAQVNTFNNARQAGAITSKSLILADTSNNVQRANSGSNIGTDSSSKTTNELLRRIESAINNEIGTTNETLDEINARQSEGAGVATAAATIASSPVEANFNINIEGQQQVRVTGLTEGINTAIQQVLTTFGPFVTEDQVRGQLIQPILDEINRFFAERGLPPLGFQ
jgi:hypothetical protein